MRRRSIHLFTVLKVGTLVLLGAFLFVLGTPAHQASLGAYLSFLAIMVLQGLELRNPISRGTVRRDRGLVLLRLSIFLQLIAASVLVALTDGSGSIYELIYLLPIVSAAARLSGLEVVFVVGGAILAMVGFIVTGQHIAASQIKLKDFQDSLAAIVYFTMAGILTYLFAEDERDQRSHYQAMASALADTNARLRRVQAELTERLLQMTQMEERLQRIGQMAALGEMAGQIAHEVRNPLGIIKGAAEMMAGRISDPVFSRHVAVLLEEVEHLNKAVESLLRLGAPWRLETKTVILHDLLASVAQAVAATASTGGHAVRVETPSEPIRLRGDAELLQHALVNLARNALQAMPSPGLLVLTGMPGDEAHDVRITVSDTGVGLSEDDLKHLGEPFFTKRAGGVGLGFALARRIVSSHGGRLDVSSTLGQGTCVIMHLSTDHRRRPEAAAGAAGSR